MKSSHLLRRASTPALLPRFLSSSRSQPVPMSSPFRFPQQFVRWRKPSPSLPLRFGRSARRQYSDQKPPYNPTPHLNSPTPSLSLSQRLRKLSREYGWSAFGVYMLLTALDFPFCFAAVRYLGADRIGRYEHVLVEWVKSAIPEQLKERWREFRQESGPQVVRPAGGEESNVDGYTNVDQGAVLTGYDHGVREAEERSTGENASIWTQLALAYAIHKSFIFIRVPVTVAITPKVVKVLRGWGWDIGKRRPKP